jgi:MFS family permease
MLGGKPIFLAGLALFGMGSAARGAAPTRATLISARLIHGRWWGCLIAVKIAMITDVPARKRGRALGINAILRALGVSTGPSVGGLITQYLTWCWMLYMNVPSAIVTLPWRRRC